MIQLHKGDCLEVMQDIEALVDILYGASGTLIPFEPMWEQLNRIIKPNAAIVLFGSEPFSSALRININNYKYDWIWNKKLAGNAINAKRHPLKIHEIITVFNSKIYIPQKTRGKMRRKMGFTNQPKHIGKVNGAKETMNDMYYPKSIQDFTIANLRRGRLHPTQKPVALMEYLIKTYTNQGETVLDFTMRTQQV